MKTPISPKVIIAAIVGIILTSVVSNISAITPDMFDFLGPWKLFWFGTAMTVLISLGAWWKSDPLRILPGDAKSTDDAAAAALAANQTSVAATTINPAAPFPAPATSFADTQAKIDAIAMANGAAVTPANPSAPIDAPNTHIA